MCFPARVASFLLCPRPAPAFGVRAHNKERRMRLRTFFIAIIVAMLPLAAVAQHGKHAAAPETAAVDFGVLPLTPIGPPPCLQTGGIGGPADPCSYKLHHLTPEEVTIQQNGEVTFQVHGGGHGMAIYKVSKNTTRDRIGQYLCAGTDPETLADPNSHVCNLSAANANAQHIIADGR